MTWRSRQRKAKPRAPCRQRVQGGQVQLDGREAGKLPMHKPTPVTCAGVIHWARRGRRAVFRLNNARFEVTTDRAFGDLSADLGAQQVRLQDQKNILGRGEQGSRRQRGNPSLQGTPKHRQRRNKRGHQIVDLLIIVIVMIIGIVNSKIVNSKIVIVDFDAFCTSNSTSTSTRNSNSKKNKYKNKNKNKKNKKNSSN